MALFPLSGHAQDLTITMPPDMVASGLDKQLLPRFGFKHRIRIGVVPDGADMALSPEVEGPTVFSGVDGTEWHLTIVTDEADKADKAATFLKWLKSEPGKAAIETFAPDGAQVFTTEESVVEVAVEETFDGDTEAGGDLALLHCGRCHVVDTRNRMGGIGSTPSFAALRGRENWSDLFRAFYVHNPHPSFTVVDGVTEPFTDTRQSHVAPMEITLEDVDAILAFVSTLKPKDLGGQVQAN